MTGVPLDVGGWSAQFGFIADAEDDRNRRCCGFGSERGPLSRRDDHGHLSTDQVRPAGDRIGLPGQWYSTATFWPSM